MFFASCNHQSELMVVFIISRYIGLRAHEIKITLCFCYSSGVHQNYTTHLLNLAEKITFWRTTILISPISVAYCSKLCLPSLFILIRTLFHLTNTCWAPTMWRYVGHLGSTMMLKTYGCYLYRAYGWEGNQDTDSSKTRWKGASAVRETNEVL